MIDNWIRVTHNNHCPICHKPDWCMVSRDGTAAICQRIGDGGRFLGEAGYLHIISKDVERPRRAAQRPKPQPKPSIDWWPIVSDCCERLYGTMLGRLANDLGVSDGSLSVLDIGQDVSGNWTFPMFDHDRRPVGIRIRANTGKKWAWPGSRNAIFLPCCKRISPWLLVCEGPTDTAAAIDLKFDAVGRPSCSGGVNILARYCANRNVVIMSDYDGPGMDGSRKLATVLVRKCPAVRIVCPLKGKDIREWLSLGATHDVVLSAIRQIPNESPPTP